MSNYLLYEDEALAALISPDPVGISDVGASYMPVWGQGRGSERFAALKAKLKERKLARLALHRRRRSQVALARPDLRAELERRRAGSLALAAQRLALFRARHPGAYSPAPKAWGLRRRLQGLGAGPRDLTAMLGESNYLLYGPRDEAYRQAAVEQAASRGQYRYQSIPHVYLGADARIVELMGTEVVAEGEDLYVPLGSEAEEYLERMGLSGPLVQYTGAATVWEAGATDGLGLSLKSIGKSIKKSFSKVGKKISSGWKRLKTNVKKYAVPVATAVVTGGVIGGVITAVGMAKARKDQKKAQEEYEKAVKRQKAEQARLEAEAQAQAGAVQAGTIGVSPGGAGAAGWDPGLETAPAAAAPAAAGGAGAGAGLGIAALAALFLLR